MMVVETETPEFVCWCTCHGKWITIRRAISCKECVELCMKEEGVYRIEFVCIKENPPSEVEVEYE